MKSRGIEAGIDIKLAASKGYPANRTAPHASCSALQYSRLKDGVRRSTSGRTFSGLTAGIVPPASQPRHTQIGVRHIGAKG
jgi:hypothetical protein